jgi:hypothetical protein
MFVRQQAKQAPSPASLHEVDIPEGTKAQLVAVFSTLDGMAQAAAGSGARLLVDAEQTYFQPAIDLLVRELQRKHNTKGVVVYNTIQGYLKDSRCVCMGGAPCVPCVCVWGVGCGVGGGGWGRRVEREVCHACPVTGKQGHLCMLNSVVSPPQSLRAHDGGVCVAFDVMSVDAGGSCVWGVGVLEMWNCTASSVPECIVPPTMCAYVYGCVVVARVLLSDALQAPTGGQHPRRDHSRV